jgi:hypothetical protein
VAITNVDERCQYQLPTIRRTKRAAKRASDKIRKGIFKDD